VAGIVSIGAIAFMFAMFFLVLATGARAERRDSRLARIAAALSGSFGGNAARGTHRGLAVTFTFDTRGSGSTSESWTVIDAEIPRMYPLEMHVRRHKRSDHKWIASGDMIDVEVGDPVFDPMFLVEAAPADVARILLDPETRGYLASHGDLELDTCIGDSGARLLRLAVRGWMEDLPEAMAAVASVTHVGARIREAYAFVDRAHQPVDQGSPYRPVLDDSAARDAADTRARELANLQGARSRRAEATRAAGILLLVGILVAFLFALAAAASR
jgi:hypothetical protein